MILSHGYGMQAPGMMLMSPVSMTPQRIAMLQALSQSHADATPAPTPTVAPTPTPTVTTTGAATGTGIPDGSLISNGYVPIAPHVGVIQQPSFFSMYWPYLAAGGVVLAGIIGYVALRK